MFTQINNFITWFDGVVWGLPLIILILFTGILLTTRLGLLQVRHLGKALKFMVKNEEGGDGEVTSFGALCTALSATIGTGNTVPLTKKATFSADLSTTSKTVWENSGDGLPRSSHFSEQVWDFSVSEPLHR